MALSEWTAQGSATAAPATATKAAVAGQHHIITGVIASYSAATIALLTVKFGTTTVLERYIHNAADLLLPDGLRNPTANEAVSAELAAGAAGVVGKVALTGRTI
jgi:hypothetical protein